MKDLRAATDTLSLPEFIAVTGREGSGKDSYGDHLAKLGYLHIPASNAIRDYARSQGHSDPIPRDVLSQMGDKLKQQFGPSPITESSLEEYNKHRDLYPAGLVISGFRRVGEVAAFKQRGAVCIWIDADDASRFANVQQRVAGEKLSREVFLERSDIEYYGQTNGGKDGVNIHAVEQLADCRVSNDGTLEDLYQNADQALHALI